MAVQDLDAPAPSGSLRTAAGRLTIPALAACANVEPGPAHGVPRMPRRAQPNVTTEAAGTLPQLMMIATRTAVAAHSAAPNKRAVLAR
jgi:hypothetical protein